MKNYFNHDLYVSNQKLDFKVEIPYRLGINFRNNDLAQEWAYIIDTIKNGYIQASWYYSFYFKNNPSSKEEKEKSIKELYFNKKNLAFLLNQISASHNFLMNGISDVELFYKKYDKESKKGFPGCYEYEKDYFERREKDIYLFDEIDKYIEECEGFTNAEFIVLEIIGDSYSISGKPDPTLGQERR